MEQNWTAQEYPEGFRLDIPANWKVAMNAGLVNVTGPDMERVTILPFKFETHLNAEGARDILLAISRQFWPQQHWQMPRGGWQVKPNGVGAIGADESRLKEIATLWWENTPEGATGFFYTLAAPPARFPSLQTDFARILSSFSVTRGGGQPGANDNPLAGMQFQTWIDPMENAFSVEVPAGWHVRGGVFRPNMVSMSEFVLQSPDGRVIVRSGDVNFPSKYIVPDMNLMSLGIWEGQFTSDGTLALNHKTGQDFAVYYLQNTVARNCRNLQWLDGRNRADRIQALGWYTQMLGFAMHTAGEVIFSCDFGGPTYLGYQYAETAITHSSNVATLWNPQALFGFLATPENVWLADAVLFRAITTFQTNPQWMMRQANINHQTAEANRQYSEYSNQLWQQTQAERWASWDRIAERRGDVLRGHTRVVDPTTGQAYKVQSGSSYYSIDPTRQVIVGTDIPFKPDWKFEDLIETYY
ncbi:MAG TPA: hypothetical protein VGX24_09435 [Pyrinomonadaceae bacterium]|jgi:hypothetical protein|nr:hypothetical protein [Pyrinomonadaceae bacterium]